MSNNDLTTNMLNDITYSKLYSLGETNFGILVKDVITTVNLKPQLSETAIKVIVLDAEYTYITLSHEVPDGSKTIILGYVFTLNFIEYDEAGYKYSYDTDRKDFNRYRAIENLRGTSLMVRWQTDTVNKRRFYNDGGIVGKRCNCNDECPPDMICVNGVCVPAEKSYNIKEDKHTGLYLIDEVFYD